ncbi:MAG TPA: protoporphyrinogen oxidase [Candidatus Krumholzibacteria bacterium]|nr:protoporphyrinogen oxidase [Candidatus Krumholzibacteria bacterium]
MPPSRTRVAVVGAGISGLALGFHLQRLGVEVQVLEERERAGGNIRSEHRQGYLCEWGPNGWLDNEPATARLVEALGMREQVVQASVAASRRWIVRHGKLRLLPEKPQAFLSSDVLSLRGRLRVLLEWAQPARRDGASESVFDFAARRIGREAAEVLVDAMVTGIYAGDSRRLDMECAFPRLREMERRHGGLFRAMAAKRRAARQASASGGGAPRHTGSAMGPGGTLTSFTDGMESIVHVLSSRLSEHLRLGTAVEGIEPVVVREAGVHRWRLALPGRGSLEAEHVVLASPAWKVAPLLRPLDPDLAGATERIPSAPVAVVCLGFAAPDLQHLTPGFGFLVPGCEGLPILGTLFDSWVFPHRSDARHILMRTMLGGARDPGAVEASDAELAERTLGTLRRLLGLRADPERVFVVRHPRGIPQYPVGHRHTLERIDTALTRHAGLHLSGNSYRGIAMNACIKEAEALAQRLAGI